MSCQLQALKRKVQGTCCQITVVLTEAMKHWCHTVTSKHEALQLFFTNQKTVKQDQSKCLYIWTSIWKQAISPVENEMLLCLPERGFLRISDKLCYRETLMTEPALHGAILGEWFGELVLWNGDWRRGLRREPITEPASLDERHCQCKVQIYKHDAWIFSQNSFVNLFYTSFFLSTVLLYVTFC